MILDENKVTFADSLVHHSTRPFIIIFIVTIVAVVKKISLYFIANETFYILSKPWKVWSDISSVINHKLLNWRPSICRCESRIIIGHRKQIQKYAREEVLFLVNKKRHVGVLKNRFYLVFQRLWLYFWQEKAS